MNSEQFNGITMASPSEGFVQRVMARVDAYERARARRRAIIGAGVCGVFAFALMGALFALFGVESTVSLIASGIASLAIALPLDVSILGEAVITTFGAIRSGLDGVLALAYAFGVFALTMLWLGIVVAPQRISLRGVR